MKILFVQKKPCLPADLGWKIRTANVVRYLARHHELLYLSNVTDAEAECGNSMRAEGIRTDFVPWCDVQMHSGSFYYRLVRNLLSPFPYNVEKDFDPAMKARARQWLEREEFDLVVCDFVQTARNVIGLAGPPKLLFQHNVEAEIFKRHAIEGRGLFFRAYMALQWLKMHRFEKWAGRRFDGVVAVSDRDKRIYEKTYGWNHVRVIDTSVDVDFFRRSGRPPVPGRVVFVGGLDWLANVDALRYFADDVWPAVRRARPDASFHIVGRNPLSEVRALGKRPGITVIGTVPDVRPHWNDAEVAVVPLRIGGGTRLKIPEALAMEKAVVTTSLGMEGLPLTPGEHLLTADSAQEFANSVLRLLNNEDLRRHVGSAGAEQVRARCSSERVAKQFEQICLQVARLAVKAEPLVTRR